MQTKREVVRNPESTLGERSRRCKCKNRPESEL